MSKMQRLISCGLMVLTVVVLGCTEEARMEGQVVDNFEEPIEGVQVQIAGLELSDETDSKGRYSVPFIPGAVAVGFSKQGYQGVERKFEIAENVQVPLKPVELFRYPEGMGAWFIGETDYEALAPAEGVSIWPERIGSGFGVIRMYSIDGEETEVELNGPPAEDGAYWQTFIVNTPGEFVVLQRAGNHFRLQPHYKLEVQGAVVSIQASKRQGGVIRYLAKLRSDQTYALATLGEESCGFAKCTTLEQPAYLIRPRRSEETDD